VFNTEEHDASFMHINGAFSASLGGRTAKLGYGSEDSNIFGGCSRPTGRWPARIAGASPRRLWGQPAGDRHSRRRNQPALCSQEIQGSGSRTSQREFQSSTSKHADAAGPRTQPQALCQKADRIIDRRVTAFRSALRLGLARHTLQERAVW